MKVKFLLHGMSLLGYDAINLGEKDLQYGRKFLEQLRDEYNLPFVSTNVYLAGTKKLFARPYIIRNYGNLKVGIFGITDNTNVEKIIFNTGFTITDPIQAAKPAVEYLRRNVDVVVALSHLGIHGARELARKVPGIDIIISGHNRTVMQEPEQIGSTWIMQPGYQGKYLGEMEVVMVDKKIDRVKGKLVALNKKIPDDPELAKLVKDFDQALIEMFPMEKAKADRKFSKISEINCLRCHMRQYKQWRSTLHYVAWKTLVDKKQNHNPECQQCHTTRFGEPTGFKSVYETPDLVNVQCAQCHREKSGDITEHYRRMAMRRIGHKQSNGQFESDFEPVTEKICLKCHNEDNSPNFNYEEYLAKVTH